MITTNYASVARSRCACGQDGHGSPVFIDGEWTRLCLTHAREVFRADDHAAWCDGRVTPVYAGSGWNRCACRKSESFSASR